MLNKVELLGKSRPVVRLGIAHHTRGQLFYSVTSGYCFIRTSEGAVRLKDGLTYFKESFEDKEYPALESGEQLRLTAE